MNIGEYSVRNPVISWLLVVIMVGGGIMAFQTIGKLEDPPFTIKMAKILTPYPGATAQEVQDELTYHLEDAIQLLPQVKRIKMSVSRPGLSDILIEFKDEYQAKDLPNIFDELRRKIADVSPQLPPGASAPIVLDDFGDVYGAYVMLHGEGYSWRDLYDTADAIKKQLVLIDGVRKVVIDGEQKEVVYLDISRSQLADLGISLGEIANVLGSQNVVVDAGNVQVGDDYLRFSPTGAFQSVLSMGDLLISSSERRLIRLSDIATISRSYETVPRKIYYVNGEPGLSLGISMVAGENVVAVGDRIDDRLRNLLPTIPVGMKLTSVYDQPKEVDASVSGFLVSVAQAVAIVIVVLLIFMGLRTGLVIGAVLIITVAGTLFIMNIYGIELQRISLGALVIALGMLVDNAIVVAEGMLVRMNGGMTPVQAAREAVGKTIWALLGGTVIGILAFSAIGMSPDNTGEFASSLFYVILISLSLSWITAISTTPLLCALLLKPDPQAANKDPYGGKAFQFYRGLVAKAIDHRWVTVSGVIGLFVAAVIGFGNVAGGFFPDSNTPLFFVDVWEPEGADIRTTRDDTLRVSEFIREQPGVLSTASVIGGPHQRFTLVYDSREPAPVYSQIIVRTETREQIPAVWEATAEFMREEMPWTDPIIKALRIGPGRDAKIEARFSGPNAQKLRELSEQAQQLMRDDGFATDIRDDWRSPVKVASPVFNEQVGRQLGVDREGLGGALRYAFEGATVGVYRDGIRLLPIELRAPEDERGDINNVRDIQIWSPVLGRSVPASQIVAHYETGMENAVIRGRDRIQTIIASCNPEEGLATELFERLRPQIEAMELPAGYKLEWGGEYEDSVNAQAGLGQSLPVGFMLMILTSIFLFGKLRQPTIIWLTVPLAIVGITAGLLVTGGAFDFMSLLGALSLVGLLIKNAIVLIEEIDQQIEEDKEPYEAILDSSVTRMRPVMLAAATTILGLIPLLSDVFFVNMSVTIMAGLGFASLLTLTIVPTLYAIFFGIHKQENDVASRSICSLYFPGADNIEGRPYPMKILVLDEDYRQYQAQLSTVGVMSDAGSDPDAFSGEYDVLLAQPSLAAMYLQRGHSVSWIQSTWAGIDGLVPVVQSSDVVITGIKDIFGPQMAEYVFAFLLQDTRTLSIFSEQQSKGLWSPSAPGSLVGQTMLVLGAGTIGTHIAGVAKAFGMETLGVSRSGQSAQGFDRVVAVSELSTVVAQANVLINTLPSTGHTRKIIDGPLLQALPADATVFNLGRGDALCEAALRVWLDTHEEANAVLDVFAVEPLSMDHWMWRHPQISITPHIAAVSFPQDVIRIFLDNLRRWRDGLALAYVIDPKRGY